MIFRYCHLPLLILLLIANSAAARNFANVSTLNESTYKILSSAQKSLKKGNYRLAITVLDTLKKSPSLNGYEKAMMWSQYGAVHFSAGDLLKATAAYEKLLLQEKYPKGLKLKTLFNLAQIYFKTNQYRQTISRLNNWFELTDTPTEQAYFLQAQANYYLQNHQQVVDNLNQALAIVKAKNIEPNEQWLLMLQSSLDSLGLAEHRLGILKWMLRLFPTKDYMLSLAGTYGILEKQPEQLAIMELAYKKDYLDTEPLLLTLASLLYFQGAPYKAANVVQQGFNNNTIKTNPRNLLFLSNCLRAAQEFEQALPVLKQSAKISDNADTYYLLATTYYQLGRWQLAADAFSLALDKKLTRNQRRTWMLLGQTYLQLHQFDNAKSSFIQASTFENNNENSNEKDETIASQWLVYTEQEQKRFAFLQSENQKDIDYQNTKANP
ncbi:MAG: hypothetical protein COA99_05550 [Moraxellaceae bacterium]|nr:MAG: hypothetical protein COA99_05550 [Moraxellaceae bacterium]